MRNSISACDSAMVAGFNRRTLKTACPVVWEGLRAQSRRPDPIITRYFGEVSTVDRRGVG